MAPSLRLFAALLVALPLLLAPCAARADQDEVSNGLRAFAISTAIAVPVINTAFTVLDVRQAAAGRVPSRGDGSLELAMTGTGAAASGLLTSLFPQSAGLFLPLGIWSLGLSAHGVWALAHPRPDAPPVSAGSAPAVSRAARERPARAFFDVGPTVLVDGRTEAPGVAIAGRF